MTVFISKKAIERIEKDSYIENNLKKYLKEVKMLIDSNWNRPSEKIGEFNITPRGHEKIRIAWHRKEDNFYIDDFLYHENSDYVDKWNRRL